MSLASARLVARAPSIEWPTVAVVATIYCAWLALTWFHEALPLWLWLPFAAWTAGWWGSAQHEMVHGHPTRSRAFNRALATPPIWLWLPFERYRVLHLDHHRDDRLTDPIDDPETRYWTPVEWRALGPAGRLLVDLQSTLLGRLTIGPLWTIGCFAADEARAIWDGDRDRRRVWTWHALWTALVSAWAFAICGVPLWQYLAGFVYLGLALTLIRSFAEHRAAAPVVQRTAIVENSRLLGVLFLHNNLHVVHHNAPAVPWYRLPRLYRDTRAAVLAMNGGLVYDGYGDVFCRFLLRRHDHPVHPLIQDGTQAGTAYPAALASASQRKVVA
jgi:fatty acid desaturase